MRTVRILTAAALIAASGLAQAQLAGTRRIDLQRHDLSAPGREVIQARVEIDPGATSPKHTHPEEEIIYVLEGSLESTHLLVAIREIVGDGDHVFVFKFLTGIIRERMHRLSRSKRSHRLRRRPCSRPASWCPT